jgi:hypothetical protein
MISRGVPSTSLTIAPHLFGIVLVTLKAEVDYLSVFARRLNDLASKGAHAEVTSEEAKQGLLGLYMYLFNVTARASG